MEKRANNDRLTRWWGAGCALLSAAPFACLAGYFLWAYSIPKTPLDTRPRPGPNGFNACVAAVNKLPEPNKDSPLTRPPMADPRVLKRLLRSHEPALRELREAMRLDYMSPPQHVTDRKRYLGRFRVAARDFAAEARVALGEGRPGEAVEDSLDALDLGCRVGRGGTMIHHLVGISLVSIGARQTDACVSRLSVDDAARAGARLDRIIRRCPTAEDAIIDDRFFMRGALLRAFQGRMNPAAMAGLRQRGPFPWFLHPKPKVSRALESYYRELLREARKPYRVRRPVPDPRDSVALLFCSGDLDGFLPFARRDAILRTLRLELALQEYRQRAGRYPDALAKLMPVTLKSLPADPFSDQPFRYRRTGAGYLLYSIGPDGVDDGGRVGFPRKADSKGDLVAGKLFPPPRK